MSSAERLGQGGDGSGGERTKTFLEHILAWTGPAASSDPSVDPTRKVKP
jgi:hypothetical protein